VVLLVVDILRNPQGEDAVEPEIATQTAGPSGD
jgi:hypothetical protein